jgi:N-acetyl-anhydromuramyl-L-alanine amidase AmpD
MTLYNAFILAKWFYKGRQGKKVRLIVLHCTVSGEIGTGAEAVAHYFARGERKASAHCAVDNNSTVGCVQDEDTAFAAAGANNDGWHVEIVGQPDQTAQQWADAFSEAALERAAVLCRDRATKFGIPLRWLTIAELAAGKAGFCTHADVSAAFPKVSTGHWDPGPNFPKQHFMDLVRGIAPAPTPLLEDLVPSLVKKAGDDRIVLTLDFVTGRHVKAGDDYNACLVVAKDHTVHEIPAALFDEIRLV